MGQPMSMPAQHKHSKSATTAWKLGSRPTPLDGKPAITVSGMLPPSCHRTCPPCSVETASTPKGTALGHSSQVCASTRPRSAPHLATTQIALAYGCRQPIANSGSTIPRFGDSGNSFIQALERDVSSTSISTTKAAGTTSIDTYVAAPSRCSPRRCSRQAPIAAAWQGSAGGNKYHTYMRMHGRARGSQLQFRCLDHKSPLKINMRFSN
jgi:hypothetical protein